MKQFVKVSRFEVDGKTFVDLSVIGQHGNHAGLTLTEESANELFVSLRDMLAYLEVSGEELLFTP